jgi:hypothetical protein
MAGLREKLRRPARVQWALRPAGLMLLIVAWRAGHLLAAVGVGHTSHQPALAYALALLVFICGTSGTALALLGPHLFDRIVVARRWLP